MEGAYPKILETIGLRGTLGYEMMLGALVLIRIVPVVFQTPFLGGKLVPPETRIGISLMLAIMVFPYARSGMETDMAINAMAYLVLMAKELFIGFVIGYIAAELFYAMEIAGRAVDVMRGANQAEVQVPELQLRVSPIGQFNFQLLLVIFCVFNGHGHFIESILTSFEMVPIDGWPKMTGGWEYTVDRLLYYISNIFTIAFGLVFPGLFASFLVDVAFGMFNRIAPQLNAYFMAMGIKAVAGLFMFMVCLGLFMGELSAQLEHSLLFIRRILTFFG